MAAPKRASRSAQRAGSSNEPAAQATPAGGHPRAGDRVDDLRPLGWPVPGRHGRRRHQARTARRRPDALDRAATLAVDGCVFPDQQPQQAQHRRRPQDARGPRHPAAPGGQDRRAAALDAHACGQPFGAGLRHTFGGQRGPRVLPRQRLCRRRSVRRSTGLRRHHPGRIRPGHVANRGRRPAALHPDHRGRQDQRRARGLRHRVGADAPHAHRAGPAGRRGHVRDHGRFQHDGTPVGPCLRAAAGRHGLRAGQHRVASPVQDEGRLHRAAALFQRPLETLLRAGRCSADHGRPALRHLCRASAALPRGLGRGRTPGRAQDQRRVAGLAVRRRHPVLGRQQPRGPDPRPAPAKRRLLATARTRQRRPDAFPGQPAEDERQPARDHASTTPFRRAQRRGAARVQLRRGHHSTAIEPRRRLRRVSPRRRRRCNSTHCSGAFAAAAKRASGAGRRAAHHRTCK